MTTVTAALDSRMTETDSITCMLADDHPAVLDSISRVLASQGFDVVAQARDGDDALKAIEEQRPQVSIVDLRMPGMSGIAVARRASKHTSHIRNAMRKPDADTRTEAVATALRQQLIE